MCAGLFNACCNNKIWQFCFLGRCCCFYYPAFRYGAGTFFIHSFIILWVACQSCRCVNFNCMFQMYVRINHQPTDIHVGSRRVHTYLLPCFFSIESITKLLTNLNFIISYFVFEKKQHQQPNNSRAKTASLNKI